VDLPKSAASASEVQPPRTVREHFYADDPSEPPETRNARLASKLDDPRDNRLEEYRSLMACAEREADQFEQVFGLRYLMPEGQWNV
jgi:hypothetical protein